MRLLKGMSLPDDGAQRVARLLARIRGGEDDPSLRWEVVGLIEGELRSRLRRSLGRQYPGVVKDGATAQFSAVVHDFFLRIVGSSHLAAWRLETRDDLIRYSARAIENLVISHLRRRRHQGTPVSGQSADDRAMDRLVMAQTENIAQQKIGSLADVIETLQQMEEEAQWAIGVMIVRLRFWSGRTFHEIARVTGASSTDAVRRRFHECLDEIRARTR